MIDDTDESARNTSLFFEDDLDNVEEENGASFLRLDPPESYFFDKNKGVYSLLSDAYHRDDLDQSVSTSFLSSDAQTQTQAPEDKGTSPQTDRMDFSGVLTQSESPFFSGFIAEKEDDHTEDLPLKEQPLHSAITLVEEPIRIVNKLRDIRKDSNFITTIQDYFLTGNGRHYFWEKDEDESIIADLLNKNKTLLSLSTVFLDIKIIEPVLGHEINEGDQKSLLDWYLLLEPNSVQDLIEKILNYKSPEIGYLPEPAWVRGVYYESFLAWYVQEALQHRDKYDPSLAIKKILSSRSTPMINVLLNKVVTDGGQDSQTYLSWYLQDLAEMKKETDLKKAIQKILPLRVPRVQRILLEQFTPKNSHQQSWLNWYKHTDPVTATKKILASQCLELINELVIIDINQDNQSQCSALEFFIKQSSDQSSDLRDAIESIFSASKHLRRCNKVILFLLNKPLQSSYSSYADYYFSTTILNNQLHNENVIKKITNAYEKLRLAANNARKLLVLSDRSTEIIKYCLDYLKNTQKDTKNISNKKKPYSVLINKRSTRPSIKKFLKDADIQQVVLFDEEMHTGCIIFSTKEPINLIFSREVVAHLRKIHQKDKDLASKIVLPSPQQESAPVSLDGSGNKRPRSPQSPADSSGAPAAKQAKLNWQHTFFAPVYTSQDSTIPLASDDEEQSNTRSVI